MFVWHPIRWRPSVTLSVVGGVSFMPAIDMGINHFLTISLDFSDNNKNKYSFFHYSCCSRFHHYAKTYMCEKNWNEVLYLLSWFGEISCRLPWHTNKITLYLGRHTFTRPRLCGLCKDWDSWIVEDYGKQRMGAAGQVWHFSQINPNLLMETNPI